MNDRVRVYELARQMNIPNEDVITTLRELGHDIKSHSSTVDKVAVGQLISALNKKKQQPEKAETKAKGAKTAGATGATKAAAKAPVAPPPPVVKPRVLARYRRPDAPGTEAPLQEVAEVTPAATAVAAVVAPPEVEEETIQEPASNPAAVEAPVANNGGQAVQTPPTVASTSAPIEAPATAPVVAEAEKPESDPIQPAAETATEEIETQKGDKAEPKVEQNENDTDSYLPPFSGQAVKPMAPSVPVRIAAPSQRATPPRPPKSHRPTPSERHAQKKDDRSRPAAVAPVEVPRVITLTNSLTVKELAEKMNVPDTEVIKRLFMRGFPRTVNQTVEYELAKDLAIEMEYEVLSEDLEALTAPDPVEPELSPEEQASLVLRPPVVTIMGHVDHGKTSLLDAIRQTKFLLTESEAGGITQHIGAYHVEVESEDGTMRQIVFLDTPGHEAFTAMRARGAKATDIAILVVAADDGVMPQTIEAIDHAKAAGVPIIVAVNKIDKADAEPDRVLSQLMEHGLLPDKFGGETVTVNVSAKKRTGLDELLEMILLVADIQDLKANPDKPATGVIIEAELSRGKGAVATALVENGTLREGDYIVAGSKSGRVRALFDDRGQRVKAAGPSMPVEVLGLDEVPQAGDRFEVVSDVHASKVLIEQRKLGQVERKAHHVSLESLHEMLTKGEVKDLNVIVKADVQGTAEAIAEQVKKLSGNEVAVRVLRTASGDISENDVNLAASSEAIIIGFNVNPDQNARQVAEVAGVDIRTYNIIYQITDDLEKAIQGLIQPVRKEVKIGVAEVRQIFKFGKQLMIGGCMVIEGKVQRGCIAKIERNGQIVHEGKLDTLKRFKDDVKEVAQGFECGMSFEKFSDLQEGDKINAYVIQESKGEITR
ncbi:MAG: translation initiation factor IF-2 [Candidatus Obscuribacterales bacterium]|nr:translation initiation factor IF-2 [Cyanobacteria bacterium SZAS LIN-5]RTL38798.1 MAG: translation initiation factor IF-2 [Candidatus Melainabacteria bacterium]